MSIKSNKKNEREKKAEEIIDTLTKIMLGEDYEGDLATNKISARERLKAAELLGKIYSIFSNNNEKQIDESVYIVGNDCIND